MIWDYERFKTAVFQLTGIDLNSCKFFNPEKQ